MEEIACSMDSGANACVFNDDLSYECGSRDPNKNYKTKIIDKETGEREIEKMSLIDEIMKNKKTDNQYYIGNPIVCEDNKVLKAKCKKCMTSIKDCEHIMGLPLGSFVC